MKDYEQLMVAAGLAIVAVIMLSAGGIFG